MSSAWGPRGEQTTEAVCCVSSIVARPEHREPAILLYNSGSVKQRKARGGGGGRGKEDEKINSRKERKEDASQRVVPLDRLVLPVRERFPETSFPPSTQHSGCLH